MTSMGLVLAEVEQPLLDMVMQYSVVTRPMHDDGHQPWYAA